MNLSNFPLPVVGMCIAAVFICITTYNLGYKTGISRKPPVYINEELKQLFKQRRPILLIKCIFWIGAYIRCFIWMQDSISHDKIARYVPMLVFLFLMGFIGIFYSFGVDKDETSPYDWSKDMEDIETEVRNHGF